MIGNDIIDLAETRLKSNWEHPGFLKKVFSLEEQTMIHTASNSFQTVWRLWSMKESAYKFYMQKYPEAVRGFYPAKIICSLESLEAGRVFIQGVQLKTETVYHPNYLFSIAFSNQKKRMETEIFYLKNKDHKFQSSFSKEKLLNFISEKKQLEKTDLVIKKGANGAPQIFYKSKLLPLSCSTTHHGNYGGFSIAF